MNRVFQLDSIIQEMGLCGMVWIQEDEDGGLDVVVRDECALTMLKLDGRWEKLLSKSRLVCDTRYMYQGQDGEQ